MELYMRVLVVLWLCFMFAIPMKLVYCDGHGLRPHHCREEEREALLNFKKGIYDPSGRLSSWVGDECCTWEGVGCHNTTGHILKLNLPTDPLIMMTRNYDMILGGELSSSLLKLKHLRYLDLSGNDGFKGPIPKFLGSISNLRYVNLSWAGFSGAIPHQLGNLSKLHYLDIGLNSDLYVEDLVWISRLASLEFLDMRSVNLSKASNWLQVLNKLPSLSVLHLGACHLHSINSPPLVNFASLTTLDLSFNSLSFSSNWFPSFLRNMISLKVLDLSHNELVSPAPKWLFHMTTLEYLNLSNNKFQGEILNDIENLTSITYLDISRNDLEGDDILRSLSNLCTLQLSNLSYGSHKKALEVLRLFENRLSGSIPTTIGQCKSLKNLNLRMNRLSGHIPISLGGISSLRSLDIRQNFFEGIFTDKHFANLTSLEELYASSNPRLSFQVSSNWTPPFQLTRLFLGSWHIGPQFPAWLQTQKHLEYLDMSNVGISSSIPAWFWAAPSLRSVDLSYNQIDGPLPQISCNIQEVDFSYNSFRGSLSPMLCRGISEVSSLRVLDVSNNILSGELPDCWMHWADLVVINLGNNNLSGGILNSMGSLRWLASLQLCNNRLSGILPPSMQNCTNLAFLDLSYNEFSGTIPTWMGNFVGVPRDDYIFPPGLRVLLLHSNKFSGDIPVELCDLSRSLQILILAHNRLSGTIPPCFGNFTSMATTDNNQRYRVIYLIRNSVYLGSETTSLVMKSIKYEISDKILALLTSIDLSCNNLSGEIPQELTNLRGLISLDLSNNHLQGKIPSEVGAMQSLEFLDLSLNHLSGIIPQSMAGISFLSHLNLSYNNLSGRIPSGTQIQGFETSSFKGNDGLCGPPLTDYCLGDHAPSSQDDDEDSDGMEMKWFYLSLPLGFVVGFWAVLGPLLFNRRCRHFYFQFLDDMKYIILGWM